jgi:hypothetical protein
MRVAAKCGVVAALMVAGASCAWAQKKAPAATASVPTKWMLDYQGTGDANVLRDPQFAPLLTRMLPQHQVFEYGMTLTKVIEYYLDVGTGRVTVDEGRYATVTGCVPHLCNTDQGLLWVDTGSATPNVLFAALQPMSGSQVQDDTTTAWELWIFGSQLLDVDFDHVGALPDDFMKRLKDWVGDAPVGSALFVEPNGVVVPLLPKQTLHLSEATENSSKGNP